MIPPSPETRRTRPGFEGRSVQLLAAWTLAMGSLSPASPPAPARNQGTQAPMVLSSTGPAAPPPALRPAGR